MSLAIVIAATALTAVIIMTGTWGDCGKSTSRGKKTI